jgi:predicted ATPase
LSGRALWFLGFPDRALKRVEAGLALAERLAHANTLGFALAWAGFLHNFRGEFAAAQRRAEAAIGFSSEHLLPQRLAQATMCRAFALVGLGRQAEGIAELRAGLAAWNGTGAHLLDSQWLGFIAEAHLRAAEFDEALTTLDGAAQTAVAAGDCHYQAELHRLKAVVLAASGNPAEAASCFQQAIDMAQSQQAKSLELRAATSFARLWRDQGRRAEARDLLAPIYDWFTEGFDTADLKDAKALLDALG